MIRNLFLKPAMVLVAVTLLSAGSASASVQTPQTPLLGKNIPKFVEPVPVFGPASGGALPRVDGTKPLTATMREFSQQILPAANPALGVAGYPMTMVWGYELFDGLVTAAAHYPAVTIESQRNTTTSVKYVNNLVNPILQQYLTVDQTVHWADPLGVGCAMNPAAAGCFSPFSGPVPTVVHLHGGEVPSAFDGGPDAWFTPNKAQVGPGFVTDTYTYPNRQEPTTLFFHDHALGTTRLNVYAGLVGFYLLRDAATEGALNLPGGPHELELVIQDKQFDTSGQLLFPDGSPAGLNGPPPNPTIHPFWNPEFFGDVMLVNGKSWPFLNVEPRRYRLRLLNGSNARVLTLSFQTIKGQGAPVMWQIGTDGGLLNKPVKLSQLTIAPGERADVIVDFGGIKAGAQYIVRNSAKAPFPAGTSPDPQTVGQVMMINVALPLSGVDNSFNPAAAGAMLRPAPMVALASGITATTPVRRLTLNEVATATGPREVILNNTRWMAPISENPRVGNTEVWEIINTTGDTHPIHIHLVQFQILSRQAYQASKYMKAYSAAFPGGVSPLDGLTYAAGLYIPGFGPPMAYGNCNSGLANAVCGGNPSVTPFLIDGPKPPDANEAGWKDTVRMNPGEVTRVVVRWAPQGVAAGAVAAGTNLYAFDPTAAIGTTDAFGFPGGPGYVWHCHILDHEDNEMMRPYMVQP